MTKMTYVKALELALAGTMNSEVVEKLEALKASMEKRSSYQAKETKAQREVAAFTESVAEFLAAQEEPVRCGDIAKAMDVAGQKVSAALTKLVKAGRVTKELGEKKVALFSLVG